MKNLPLDVKKKNQCVKGRCLLPMSVSQPRQLNSIDNNIYYGLKTFRNMRI